MRWPPRRCPCLCTPAATLPTTDAVPSRCRKETARSGMPIMRPLFFDFHDDEASLGIDDQQMFGAVPPPRTPPRTPPWQPRGRALALRPLPVACCCDSLSLRPRPVACCCDSLSLRPRPVACCCDNSPVFCPSCRSGLPGGAGPAEGRGLAAGIPGPTAPAQHGL